MSTEQPTQMAGQKPVIPGQAIAKKIFDVYGSRGVSLFADGKSLDEIRETVISELNETIRRQKEELARLAEDSQNMIPSELSVGGSKRRQL